MREIDQIVGLRSKLGFPLLGNPHRPIPHPMDLGLAARSRLQGADRQSLSRFLRASQVWRQKWESPNPVECPRARGSPSQPPWRFFLRPGGPSPPPAPAVSPPGSMLPPLPPISPAPPATPPLSGQSLFCFS